MKKIILKRLLQYIVVLFVASIVIFSMVRISKVDPVSVILGGKQTSAETIANVRTKFNLDKPVVEQYFDWIKGMLHGDFGFGYKYQQPVGELISSRLPITLGLVFIGSTIALVLSIPMGIICALKKNTLIDTGISVLSLIFVSCPPFLTSIIMLLLAGKISPGFSITGGYDNFAQYIQRLSLPSIALSFTMIALATRVTRTGMIEQLQANYVQTATAKGLSTRKVVYGHALKNAIIPLIAVISIQIGNMIVGAVLVENVFSLAGLGNLLVTSIKSSDYPVVQGITMFLVFVFLTISTIADVLYAMIDPRIRNSL